MPSFTINSPKYGKHKVFYDFIDEHLVKDKTWCVQKDGNVFYCITHVTISKNNRKMLKLHRLILPQFKIIDHINKNGLDNRRCNLREVTNSENLRNKRKTNKKCTSKYKGVNFDTRPNRNSRWRVCIYVDKKVKTIGYFKTEIEAAKAYNEAAIKYFGEFACINEL